MIDLSSPSHRTPPPDWRLVTLVLCVVSVLVGLALLSDRHQSAVAQATPVPTAEAAPLPTAQPTPTPEPTPTAQPLPPPPTPPEDWDAPVPLGSYADPATWFRDAAFIGDSRTDGLRKFSGIKGGTFLVSVGITIYDIAEDAPLIQAGEEVLPVLDALAGGDYRKVYLSVGINELGYFAPQDFADTYAQVVDRIRLQLPDAAIYAQALIPVNAEKCLEHQLPYYITNDSIAQYNEALAAMCAQKGIWFLPIPQALLDASGQLAADYAADGVHMKKMGYQIWLDWLLSHTGEDCAG